MIGRGMNANRRRFRFTLRETLLFMLTAGAMLAWLSQRRSFEETTFLQTFNEVQLLKSLAAESDWKWQPRTRSAGSSQNSQRAVREMHTTILEPAPADARFVMAELRDAVAVALQEQGCHITGRGHSGNSATGELSDFHFDYRSGGTRGDIYVKAFVAAELWHLYILIHEF